MARGKKNVFTNRQLHLVIAQVTGSHYKTVKQWQDKGDLEYRMFRYLHNKFYLNGEPKPFDE